MSMPADTPAAVMTSPLSTNRSWSRTSMVGSSSASLVSDRPVRGRGAITQQAGGGEDERTGADAGHERAGCGEASRRRAWMGSSGIELRPGPTAARIDEDVETRCVFPGSIGQDAQALSRSAPGRGRSRRRTPRHRHPASCEPRKRGPPRGRRNRAPRRPGRARSRYPRHASCQAAAMRAGAAHPGIGHRDNTSV